MTEAHYSYTLFTDGGSRGNPGPAAYGFVIYNTAGEKVADGAQCIGSTTNNQAEYQGIVAGLEALIILAPTTPVTCKLDSQLVVRQVNGVYKMKHPDLKPWLERIRELVERLGVPVTFVDIPRAENAEADRLVNQALDAAPSGGTL